MQTKPLRVRALSEEARIAIEKYIRSMNFEESTKLPSEEQLAEQFGVSRITIRSALNDLAAEGLVLRRHGKGTFVNAEALRMKVQLSPVLDFKQMIVNSGYVPSVKLLGCETAVADDAVATMLRLKAGCEIVIVRKVFYADDHPCAVCIDYLPTSTGTAAAEYEAVRAYEDSIFEFLHALSGKMVAWDKIELVAVSSSDKPELEQVFSGGAKGEKPLLLLQGVNFDRSDEPLLYAEEYIDTDFIRFSLIRQKLIRYQA